MKTELISAAKSHASVLSEHLKRYGVTIKRTQALEIIANLHGQMDWNRVSAKLAQLEPRSPSKPLVSKSELLTQFVIGRPGSGKTETLKTVVALEVADRKSAPIFVCLSGTAHIRGMSIDHALSNMNRWDVHYSADGVREIKQTRKSHDAARIINFMPDIRESRIGLRKAFGQLLEQLHSELKSVQVGSFIIDEFSAVPHDDEHAVINAAAVFCKSLDLPVRQLLIGSQISPLLPLKGTSMDVRFVVDLLSVPFEKAGVTTTYAKKGYGKDRDDRHVSTSIDDPMLLTEIFSEVVSCHELGFGSAESSSSRLDRIKSSSLFNSPV